VLTGSRDGTARLWNIETGEQIRIFSGHEGWVNSVAFSPDEQYILTSGTDGTARLWDTDYRDFVDYACTRIFRDDLDENERIKYGITDTEPTCPQFTESD